MPATDNRSLCANLLKTFCNKDKSTELQNFCTEQKLFKSLTRKHHTKTVKHS